MRKFKNLFIPALVILAVATGFKLIKPLNRAVISASYQDKGYSKRIADLKAMEETK